MYMWSRNNHMLFGLRVFLCYHVSTSFVVAKKSCKKAAKDGESQCYGWISEWSIGWKDTYREPASTLATNIFLVTKSRNPWFCKAMSPEANPWQPETQKAQFSARAREQRRFWKKKSKEEINERGRFRLGQPLPIQLKSLNLSRSLPNRDENSRLGVKGRRYIGERFIFFHIIIIIVRVPRTSTPEWNISVRTLLFTVSIGGSWRPRELLYGRLCGDVNGTW